MPKLDWQDPHAGLSVGADLLVTLDQHGNIAHIVVTSPPDDPELVFDLDITQIGEPQDLAPPGWDRYRSADRCAATALPEDGSASAEAHVEVVTPRCDVVN
jgi:hypothetical protein